MRRLDAFLRRKQGFVEFSTSPTCMLRVAVFAAERDLKLRDGAIVRAGQKVVDIHFWNERLPQASDTQGLGWGGRFGRKLKASFGELAVAMESDPRLVDAVAVRGRLAFAGSRNAEEMRRFGRWFGMDSAEETGRLGLGRRLHDAAEDLWLLALTWTFNPGSLQGRSVVRRRDDLWVSKEKLIERYVPRAAARQAAE